MWNIDNIFWSFSCFIKTCFCFLFICCSSHCLLSSQHKIGNSMTTNSKMVIKQQILFSHHTAGDVLLGVIYSWEGCTPGSGILMGVQQSQDKWKQNLQLVSVYSQSFKFYIDTTPSNKQSLIYYTGFKFYYVYYFAVLLGRSYIKYWIEIKVL